MESFYFHIVYAEYSAHLDSATRQLQKHMLTA